jgi:VanZ family protein
LIAPLLHDASPRRAWAALLVLLMLGVCALAFSPRPPSLDFDSADKWQHLAAFFCLSASAALALAPGGRGLALAGLGMLAFGFFIEAVQMHLPARSAEWLDVVADSAGIALGLAAVALARRLWPPRDPAPG